MIGPAVLFCPADRPDRYQKAADAADAVVLDLEDAVAPDAKAAAREALVATPLDPDRTLVRLNPVSTAEFAFDLAALARTDYRTVMLAKTETARDLDRLARYSVLALCETPLGVENAAMLAAHPAVFALMWGGEDLVAALGGRSSRDVSGRYRDVVRYARSRVLVAAGAQGKEAYDSVHLDIHDDDGQRAEAEDAAASGFVGTMCIHPRQVPIVRDAYRPSAESVDRASRILAAAEHEHGVFAFEGQMVDEPLLRQARRTIEGARE